MQSTDKFRAQLDRLRTALAVREDQEVASMLEMTKAALSARKARGSFPEKELRALAQRRPDLGINVDFVLNGSMEDRRVNAAASVYEQSLHGFQKLTASEPSLRPSLPIGQEAKLIEHWRSCSALDQALVLQLIERLARRV